jgi:hypothetical protein
VGSSRERSSACERRAPRRRVPARVRPSRDARSADETQRRGRAPGAGNASRVETARDPIGIRSVHLGRGSVDSAGWRRTTAQRTGELHGQARALSRGHAIVEPRRVARVRVDARSEEARRSDSALRSGRLPETPRESEVAAAALPRGSKLDGKARTLFGSCLVVGSGRERGEPEEPADFLGGRNRCATPERRLACPRCRK